VEYFSLQDRSSFGREMFNELRFGVNRTTASTSIVNPHPGLSVSSANGCTWITELFSCSYKEKRLQPPK
jgi:hypothetical protein